MQQSNIIIIGGGIAGISAALDLANHGVMVHLIEREPTIGGHMAMLDKTFPTNDCSMCILSPKMVDVSRHPNISVHTCSEVLSIEGEDGNFKVRIRENPRYIKSEECTGCGDCIAVCPVEVYNRFDAGMGVRRAIYKPHPQAVPDIVIRDNIHCIDCGLCYDVCGKDAVLRDDEDKEKEFIIDTDTIIISTGYEVFDASSKIMYKYLLIPDVITSLEFERIINTSGPTGGKLRRVSNGDSPSNIVFIQCVGSRDIQLNYNCCSCVCCMYAIKNAILIREKNPNTKVTILYIDIRAYGKGYEEYFERAKTLGVNFIRGLPGEVFDNGKNIKIQVENTETQEMMQIEADLVILSVGLRPSRGSLDLAEKLGLSTDDLGFFECKDASFDTTSTLKPGIYLAGTCREPMDIPDSVIEGGAAAMKVFIHIKNR